MAVTVAGLVAPARLAHDLPWVDTNGAPVMLPGGGGIALGVHVGDQVDRWHADHLMPGATIEDLQGAPASAGPLHLLACIGDRVRDGSGRPLGVVAGKRGGLAPDFIAPQLVSVEVPEARLAGVLPGARIILEALGRGLTLLDHPEVGVLNLSPRLLDRLPMAVRDASLIILVRAMVPARAMGSGMGQDPWVGGVEIADWTALDPQLRLRFGDLVAIADFDSLVSRYRRPGYLSIGVVSHGPSPVPGHGIGLTIVLSGPTSAMAIELDDDASLADAINDLAREDTAP